MVAEQRHDDHLREESGAHRLEQRPLRPQPHGPGPAELDADHETAAADLVHELVALRDPLDAGDQATRRRSRRAFDDRLRVDGVQRGEARGHREHVLPERRAVHDGPVHLVEHTLDDLAGGDHRADGDVTARQCFGDADEVGHDVRLLEREERAGAAEPGLHLVDREQGSVAVAEVRTRRAGSPRARRTRPCPGSARRRTRRRRRRAARAPSASRSPNGTLWHPGSSVPKRSRNSCAPFSDSAPIVSPWNAWSAKRMRPRPVAQRAYLMIVSTDSAPLLVKKHR